MCRYIRPFAGSLVLCFLWPAIGAADAPNVVSLEPANGATDVDPNTSELIARFDQDMSTGGFSVCGGGPAFPKLRGKPVWRDKRTLVLRVSLEPDHTYQMMINCPAAQNCRSADGTPATPAPWSFTTSADRSPEDQRTLNERSFEELTEAFKSDYSYLDRTGTDWKARFAKHRDKIIAAKSTSEWVDRVAKLLRPAKDPHLWMKVGDVGKATYQRKYQGNFRLESVEKALGNLAKHDDALYSARTDDDIGYILIGSWSGDRDERVAAIERRLEDLKDTKGLIVDVRPNGGGDELMARAIAQWFVKGEKIYSKNSYREASAPGGFGEVFDRVVVGNENPKLYTKRVAVLMGPANLSSCESFLLMMKQGRRVKCFGDTSGGSSGNPKLHTMPNGVEVYIPRWKDMLPDGTLLEGHGVEPDVRVKTEMSDFESGDPVLAAALKALRK
ncbi:MAG: Ig-like domain-containing protein [Phycisphaerales bacterium]|nr:Ig-like domain-containing protein [Phycisphaerales bacterium]MCB9862424.1 Ig-like domain-containing protein [Phycisphaerales bacterium]